MKTKILTILAILFIGFIFATKPVSAETARTSAALVSDFKPRDNRAYVLRRFLEERDSPLAPYSKTFVAEADKNGLDWKLVAAISGNESQFGTMIPPYSYNGWGYGVYGGNVRRFISWDEGIATVSSAIRSDYINKWGAKNVYEIGAIYAEDPMWANKVSIYIAAIEDFEEQTQNPSLSISL